MTLDTDKSIYGLLLREKGSVHTEHGFVIR